MTSRAAPWLRVSVLLAGLAAIGALAYFLTGEVLPESPREALLFQNALLLLILGSALLEHHYTKPADSLVNSLMGLITLLSVYGIAPTAGWWAVTAYCAVVFALSVLCVAASSGAGQGAFTRGISDLTYKPAVVLGRARILFSIVFLAGLSFFYSVQDPRTVALVLFWGLFVVIWPLKIPELVTSWFPSSRGMPTPSGSVLRLDNPNVVRAALDPDSRWSQEDLMVVVHPDKSVQWVMPLFSQFQGDRLLGTGLLLDGSDPELGSTLPGVYRRPSDLDAPDATIISESLGGGYGSRLVGFVIERSTIGSIHFETLDSGGCHDGMLVWCSVEGHRVYYQIVEGETAEEAFSTDKHGYRFATAVQLGTLEEGRGFTKFEWLPAMNTAVFCTEANASIGGSAIQPGDFSLGVIPNSEVEVGGDFAREYNHHTAILGATGSGKTELAFDLVRHALANGVFVVCIDLTAQYEPRLGDLSPVDLSISADTASELGSKLFDVETGQYGAGREKKALEEFAERLRSETSDGVREFLAGSEARLGLIRLEEISNTKATLWVTELYMTCLLHYAREHMGECPPILIVVEEAHTVMPEPSAMGLGDYDSRGLVGKIAQIALQGRKYGVGLLVLAQRTATVSKTVLTQCNTIISFSCIDDTSLGFLRNIFGPAHVAMIPNLPRLSALAFGKWIRAERPVVVEIPFDSRKAS